MPAPQFCISAEFFWTASTTFSMTIYCTFSWSFAACPLKERSASCSVRYRALVLIARPGTT
jgi:hypothetical protein